MQNRKSGWSLSLFKMGQEALSNSALPPGWIISTSLPMVAEAQGSRRVERSGE